jgi:hypothetical protein
MSIFISTITNDIIVKTITSITTSVISTHSLFMWFIDYKNNDYAVYKNKIIATDLHNKLMIISALIKDTIKKYYLEKTESPKVDDIIHNLLENETTIEIDNYALVSSINDNSNTNMDIFKEIPEPIKLSLVSTLEIINVINIELKKIQKKIQSHQQSVLSYVYSIKIHNEVEQIYIHNDLLDKRVELLFKIINTYHK